MQTEVQRIENYPKNLQICTECQPQTSILAKECLRVHWLLAAETSTGATSDNYTGSTSPAHSHSGTIIGRIIFRHDEKDTENQEIVMVK